jgi:ABC-type transport system substrate-binding protein
MVRHEGVRTGQRVTRRRFLVSIGGATAVSLGIAACAQPAPTAAPTPITASGPAPGLAGASATPNPATGGGVPPSATQAPAAQSGAAKRGGVLRIAVQSDWGGMDPLFSTAPLNGAYMLYGQWVGWEKNKTTEKWGPVPEMLAEWDLRPNEATFKLQKGIKFQDGTAWDAASAKWNLDRMIFDPASLMSSYFSGVDASREDKAQLAQLKETAAQTFDYSSNAVEVVSSDTVKLHLERPIAPLITVLSAARQENCPISPTAYKKLGKTEFSRNPVGAGPYRLAEWKSGDHVIMERNPDYWKLASDGKPLPYIDRLEIRLIVDDSVRLLELKSGNIDFTDRIQGKDIAGIQANPDLQILQSESSGTAYRLIFDSTNQDSPFKNPKLRKALLYAMDREAMAQTLGFGAAVPLKYMLLPGDFAYDSSLPFYAYDKAKAAQLVKDVLAETPGLAGPDGKIPVTFSIIARDLDKAQAEMIKQMADAVGINVTIEALERGAWTAKLVKVPGQPGGKFDFASMVNVPKVDDPDSQLREYFHSQGLFNVAHLDDRGWDQLLDDGVSTYDVEQRAKLYRQLEQKNFDEAWYGYLWQQKYNWAFSRKLKGFEEAVSSHWLMSEAWLE